MEKTLQICIGLLLLTQLIYAQNVGVNTETPRANLEVNGTVRIDSLPTATNQNVSQVVADSAGNLFKKSSNDSKFDLLSFGYDGGFGGSGKIFPNQMCMDEWGAMFAGSSTLYYFQKPPAVYNRRIDFGASFNQITSGILLNGSLYVMGKTSSNGYAVFRFNAADITQAYATMSFSGKTLGANSNAFSMMTTDGTYFYFSYDAGNSGNDNVIAKYSLSGSTFTYVSTTTMGSAGNMMRFFVIDGFYYGFAFAGGDNKMRKFNSGGTLVYTSEDFSSAGSIALLIGKSLFLSTSSGRNFCRIWY